MQDILTALYNATVSVGAGYLGVSFLLEMVDFWQRCEPQPPPAKNSTALDVEAIALPESQALEVFEDKQPVAVAEMVETPVAVAAATGDVTTGDAETDVVETGDAEVMESPEEAS
ncbi:MAG: hypothetical protein VKJ64_03310 [Leptolyngbyaceae bacterium]|nr:hypothetical protein [Leptolyngbyaceae bacterium]